MQDSIRHRYVVEPQRYADYTKHNGKLTISTGKDRWISAENPTTIIQ